jgi:hypothetical protein
MLSPKFCRGRVAYAVPEILLRGRVAYAVPEILLSPKF